MKIQTLLAAGALTLAANAMAENIPDNAKVVAGTYTVTVTNITKGQSFTPIIGATHRPGIRFFRTGMPASEGIEIMAEGGNTMPLAEALMSSELVGYTAGTDGLLMPGDSVSFEIEGDYIFQRLSVAAMLIPTNDTFFALNSMKLPQYYRETFVYAYDAGTEMNDESCASIPGPTCGGEGDNAEGGEGFVHLASGISGHGDLEPGAYDWRGPVARVEIKRN